MPVIRRILVAERMEPRRLLKVSVDVLRSGRGDRDTLFVEIGHKTAGYAHVLAHGPRRIRFRVQVTSQLRKPRIVVNTQV